MVEFKIKVHPEQHVAYFPKEIFQALGPDVKAVANRTAVVFYPENVTIEDVLKSLQIIQADLKHTLEFTKKQEIKNTERAE